ncbi:MAG: diguanylate cyclase response regulator [Lysobacteraceae bacterium]|nr:MAG: diguanylate cyclase response regulator [Xanthomonadaceae bacterium]
MDETLRVLIVDDQPIILEAVRAMLADAPELQVTGISDPSGAIALARELRPHVVLLDLNMEPVDGLEVLSGLRADPDLTDVSVVMLSAAEEPETKVEAFRRGANDYVVKLPSALELIARVRYHARAAAAAGAREASFQAMMESRAALELRNRQVESQKSQLELMNRELTEASLTDALTGLRNRRYLKFFLEQAPLLAQPDSERRHRAPGHFTFCLFDLDHFKQINDRYGHETGDAVLVEVARRLRQNTRENDSVMRWGGEEFLVVGHGYDYDGARELAYRVLHSISDQPMRLPGGLSLRVTCSLGFSPLPWIGSDGSQLGRDQTLNLADVALYLSKLEGRNRGYGVFPGADPDVVARLTDLGVDPQSLRLENGKGVQLVALAGHEPDD